MREKLWQDIPLGRRKLEVKDERSLQKEWDQIEEQRRISVSFDSVTGRRFSRTLQWLTEFRRRILDEIAIYRWRKTWKNRTKHNCK